MEDDEDAFLYGDEPAEESGGAHAGWQAGRSVIVSVFMWSFRNSTTARACDNKASSSYNYR